MKFGENLKNLRKMKKISQEKLAEKLGVSRQSVSKWETGESYPEMKHILKICELFHCKINDLVHDSLTDTNQLDEEIHERAIKLKKDKQIKVKKISKIICEIAKIWKILAIAGFVVSIVSILIFPFIPASFHITEEGVVYLNEIYPFVDFNSFLSTSFGKVIGYIMMGIVLFASAFFPYFQFKFAKNLEKFFYNVFHQVTPFIQENVVLLKKMAQNITIIFIIPLINILIMDILKGGKHDWGRMDIFAFVFIFVLNGFVYIFEYGYEIQRDSIGIIYSEQIEKKPVKKMNKKTMFASIGIILLGFCIWQSLDFAYFEEDLGLTYEEIETKKIELQEEYGLNLESNEWKYTLYSKNTIINQKEVMLDIYNPFVQLFTQNSHVRGYVTHGDEFINKVLPMFDIENEAMNQIVVEWNGIPVTVTQYVDNWGFAYEISNDYYLPYYQLDFKIDDNMYRFIIYNNSDDTVNGESLFYKKTNTRINELELNTYIEYLNEIIK